MAIAKIKKIEIIGLNKDRDNILALLQKLGMVELINLQEPDKDISAQAGAGEVNLAEIEEAVSFLGTFKEGSGLLEGIIGLKPLVYQRQLKEAVRNFDWQEFLRELSDLRKREKDLSQHKEKLLQKKKLLAPWRKLRLSLEEVQPTKTCGILLGVLASGDYAKLSEEVAKENIKFFSEIISEDRTNLHLCILYLREEFHSLETLLKTHRFDFVILGHQRGTIEDNLLEIDNEVLNLDEQTLKIKKGYPDYL